MTKITFVQPDAPEAPDTTVKRLVLQKRMIHVACGAVLGLAVVLRYTVLRNVPDAGSALYPLVTLLWGALGFSPPKPVMALAIAALEPQKLNEMLSLRPAAVGNALSSNPPPPTTGDLS
jgi:hypothetical protein